MQRVFCFVLFCFFNIWANQKPFLDEIVIERIVDNLFLKENFVYTFHGFKPVSYGHCIKSTDWESVILGRANYYEWLNSKKLLSQNPNYLIIEEPSHYSEHIVNIFFIHKVKFLNCLNEHFHLFKEMLGKDFSPSQLLDDLSQRRTTLRKSLKNNEMLLGVLLGYGLENSRIYKSNRHGQSSDIPKKIHVEEYEFIGPLPVTLGRVIPCRFIGRSTPDDRKFEQYYVWLSKKYSSPESLKSIIDTLSNGNTNKD